MAKPNEPGSSLKVDFASVLDDETFHDVRITCSDGVEIGASKMVLAARCSVWKAMLYGGMSESLSGKVVLQDIKSDTLRVVLLFIYTGDIEAALPLPAQSIIDTYRAATFFMLPKLMKLVMDQDKTQSAKLDYASTLLNEAVAAVPLNEDNSDLYDVLLAPFCNRVLEIGDLNRLSAEAFSILLTSTNEFEFKTPENILLLCVLEWVCANSSDAPLILKRYKVFRELSKAEEPLDIPKLKIGKRSRALLSTVMQYINLRLICPHRLAYLTEAIDDLVETSPYNLALAYHACSNTRCPPDHPSGFRGKPHNTWDLGQLGEGLIVSANDIVVQLPPNAPGPRSARFALPITLEAGEAYEWDIVIESSGVEGKLSLDTLGVIGETFNKHSDMWAVEEFRGVRSNGVMTCNRCKKVPSLLQYGVSGPPLKIHEYGRLFGSGDVVTFRLERSKDLNTLRCYVGINGTKYGEAFGYGTNYDINPVPRILYPVVTLYPQARYRLRTRT